jgi:hypothetical protein
VSPIAKHLRRGFNNGYVIQRVSFSDGSGRYKDAPLKNDFSHVHDALQYLVLGLNKRGDATDDLDDQRRDRRRRGNVDFGGGYFSGGGRASARSARRERSRLVAERDRKRGGDSRRRQFQMQAIPLVIAAVVGAGAAMLLAPKNKPVPAQTAAPLPTRNRAMTDALASRQRVPAPPGLDGNDGDGRGGAEAPSPGAKALLGQ